MYYYEWFRQIFNLSCLSEARCHLEENWGVLAKGGEMVVGQATNLVCSPTLQLQQHT